MSWMSCLDDVDWTSGGAYADAEAQQEAPTHELMHTSVIDGGAGDDSTQTDEDAANHHTNTAAKGIDGRSNEWQGAYTADLVHCRHQTGPDAVVLAMKESQEVSLVGRETAEERTVEAIAGLT